MRGPSHAAVYHALAFDLKPALGMLCQKLSCIFPFRALAVLLCTVFFDKFFGPWLDMTSQFALQDVQHSMYVWSNH